MASTPTVGDDSIIGTGANEIIDGLAGNDFIDGDGGNDSLWGGEGNDTLVAGDGNDTLLGGTGTDSLVAGVGTDILGGEAGNDTLVGGSGTAIGYWTNSPAGIVLDYQAGTVQDGFGTTDSFTDIDEFRGTNFADVLMVGDLNQSASTLAPFGSHHGWQGGSWGFHVVAPRITLSPLLGNDTITGVVGDKLGHVRVDLSAIFQPLKIDFGLGRVEYGTEVKQLQRIKNILGSFFSDTVTGTDGRELYTTNGGTDVVNLLGGNDTIFFNGFGGEVHLGAGFNTADFSAAPFGLRITGQSVANPDNRDSWDIKTLASVQFVDSLFTVGKVVGTSFDDVIDGTNLHDIDHALLPEFVVGLNLTTLHTGLKYGVRLVEGGSGNDSGQGNFFADYHDSPSAIQANSGSGTSYTVSDGWGFQDHWSFNLGIRDSSFSDTINLHNYIGTVIVTGGNDTVTVDPETLIAIDPKRSGIHLDLQQGRIDYSATGEHVDISGAVDFVYLGNQTSTFQGNDQDNLLFSGNGNDTMNGGGGNDTFSGGGGENLIDGGPGIDTLVIPEPPSAFNEWIRVNSVDEVVETILILLGGASPNALSEVKDVEKLQTNDQPDPFVIVEMRRQHPQGTPTTSFDPTQGLSVGGADALVAERDQGDVVYALGPGVGIVHFVGGADSDLLVGLPGSGQSPPSTMPPEAVATTGPVFNDMPGRGADDLFAGAGNDTVFGRSGEDNIEGGDGLDVLDGGADNDSVGGGADDDIVIGGQGDDFLVGDGGNDLLIGEVGADILYGGDGEDALRIDGDDLAVIGGAGRDVLELSSSTTGMTTFDLSAVANQNTSGVGPFVRSVEDIDASVAPAAVSITGGGGTDNHLFGSRFADTITGGSEDDLIAGQNGNDRIVVGDGNDSVYGGGGSDDIVHTGGNGVARLYEFASGEDNLVLPASAGFATAAAAVAALAQGAEGAMLTLTSGGAVIFVGLTPGALIAGDFQIL